MPDKFKNIYRIESARLQHWNYGWNAPYFITICTKNRICFFGDVVDDNMVLNEIGEIANNCWLEIPEHFPFVKLKNHIVMPNHVHGIVVIDKPDDGRNDKPDGRNVGPNVPMAMVETRLIASLPLEPSEMEPLEPTQPIKIPGGITGNKNPMLHDNLSKIIRWYKGRTTFESRKTNPDFAWQSRFHDHIIRNNESFHRISEYIINNPLNWTKDQFFK